MTLATKTIGPLHLEDLEPHRFEDLIRQLLYDFRAWRQIEATGRSGSDHGFDIRAWEQETPSVEQVDDDTEEEEDAPLAPGRLWLVQCKRERTVPPGKLAGYLDDIPEEERGRIYGVIFAAACDFSKKARDVFLAKCREMGFAEGHLWGKAEIEDMLFQPKNDHLLFAYTGISLQTRRRTLKSQLASILTMKRKANRHLKEQGWVLLRDPEETRYPFLDPDETKPRRDRGLWRVVRYLGLAHDGLRFLGARHFAYLAEDGVGWDYAETMDDASGHRHDDPWCETDDDHDARSVAWDIWEKLPKHCQAWYEISFVIPLDRIVAIDEIGDDCFAGPHIYVPIHAKEASYQRLDVPPAYGRRSAFPKKEVRVAIFPRAKAD